MAAGTNHLLMIPVCSLFSIGDFAVAFLQFGVGVIHFITLKNLKLNPKTNNEKVLKTRYSLIVSPLFANL